MSEQSHSAWHWPIFYTFESHGSLDRYNDRMKSNSFTTNDLFFVICLSDET